MKAVLDIGKTNVKLQLVDEHGNAQEAYSRKNTPLTKGPYPHADVAGIWQWFMETLRRYPKVSKISSLTVTTHGATAALINHESLKGKNPDGLVLPVLDYEYAEVVNSKAAYSKVRPQFAETLSPELPAGLNLGLQIFWQQQNFADKFEQVTQILMYPQYWGWRLTGQLVGEVTSLGCHTDLWSPVANYYSTLVQNYWHLLMPNLKPAWQVLGTVTESVVKQTGLPADCQVYVGLHDSNASYLRYLFNSREKAESFTVISTGTWTILMRARAELSVLNPERDMLANCDIYGDPIACARFMGGREYAVICERLGSSPEVPFSAEDIQSAINNLWMATPDFSEGNGPFGGHEATLPKPQTALSAGAVATLYCALMIDQRLTDLKATGAIYIEGAFLKNSLLCQLVAQLRPDQRVYLSADDTGTVQGVVLLTKLLHNSTFSLAVEPCLASAFSGLESYRAKWQQLIKAAQINASE